MFRDFFSCVVVILVPLLCILINIPFIVFYIFFGWFYIPYLLWVLFWDRTAPENGGRTVSHRYSFYWFRKYFDAEVICEASLDPEQTYLFGIHPHGIISMGVWANFVPKTIDINYRIATLKSNFFIPILRELLLYFGFISASKRSIVSCLKKGISVGIVVGGAEEALTVQEGLVLDKRKGFITIALETGASLVPVYTFGETELYATLPSSWFQTLIKRVTGFTLPKFYGRFWIIPRRKQLYTVIGEPIPVNKQHDTVDSLHKTYKEALIKLHEKHRHVMREKQLKIVK